MISCWASWRASRSARTVLARLAHERNCLGEDGRHHRAKLFSLLLGRPLNVGAVHRRDGQIDGQLDRVVGPGQLLGALHLLGKLAEPPLELIGISEQASEATSFHVLNRSPWRESGNVVRVRAAPGPRLCRPVR